MMSGTYQTYAVPHPQLPTIRQHMATLGMPQLVPVCDVDHIYKQGNSRLICFLARYSAAYVLFHFSVQDVP